MVEKFYNSLKATIQFIFGKNSYNRKQAIEMIVNSEISNIDLSKRSEILETMLLEDWSECDLWQTLPTDIQEEFELGELKTSLDSEAYDPILEIYFSDRLMAVTNEYLAGKLKQIGHNADRIKGKPLRLESCPCCGKRTITERGIYDICRVCWWEDDGSDNESAARHSSPNHLTLLEARLNYLQSGIFNPERVDLVAIKQPDNMYETGRKFEIINNYITEIKRDWKAKVR